MIRHIKNNPALEGLSALRRDIVFSTATGTELKLDLLIPWSVGAEQNGSEGRKYPLIVFVQGSGWTFPNVYEQVPQLSELSREGYVVALATHRNALDHNPAPAFLEDVKTAIRFLRANADKYGIDAERVGILGTSSGGNTALLVGMTGDDASLKTGEYAEFSDSVRSVVQCFGPTDMPALDEVWAKQDPETNKPGNIFYELAGGKLDDEMTALRAISPIYLVEKGKNYPPMLMLQGDSDPVVPCDQCTRMYDRLAECGYDSEMVIVEGAPHEGNFWSRELLGIVFDFIRKTV